MRLEVGVNAYKATDIRVLSMQEPACQKVLHGKYEPYKTTPREDLVKWVIAHLSLVGRTNIGLVPPVPDRTKRVIYTPPGTGEPDVWASLNQSMLQRIQLKTPWSVMTLLLFSSLREAVVLDLHIKLLTSVTS